MKKVEEVDLKSLKNTFESMDKDKRVLGIKLIDQAIFMQITLDDLMRIIQEKGAVTKMCQGAYDIDRANPALSQYVSMQKIYQSCLKQINDLLPKEEIVNEDTFDEDEL